MNGVESSKSSPDISIRREGSIDVVGSIVIRVTVVNQGERTSSNPCISITAKEIQVSSSGRRWGRGMACRCISSVVITQSLLPRQINAYDGRAEVHRESFDYRGPRDNERGGVVVGSRPSGADIITAF